MFFYFKGPRVQDAPRILIV